MPKVSSESSKSISIVAGGEVDRNHLSEIQNADVIIGVDRGALWLISEGIRPNIAIGDFDSVTMSERTRIREGSQACIQFSAKKDKTDLELAIDAAVRLRPDLVTMYGVLGARLDHTLGAVHMLSKLESHNICGYIVDKNNILYIVRRQKTISRYPSYPYVSILPLTSASRVSLKGFVYDIARTILRPGSTYGISNEIPGKTATIDVHTGRVLVIHSRDRRLGKASHS